MSAVQIVCVRIDPLDAATLTSASTRYPNARFVLNIPKSARSTGDAYDVAKQLGISFGGLGDAMRALREEDPGDYVYPQTTFVERIFRQHSKIKGFERLDDSRYQLDRYGLPSVVVFVSEEYEVTAESVRLAIERYGEFDAFVTSNPHALEISPEALSAGEEAGRKVYRWREFMSAVRKPWN